MRKLIKIKTEDNARFEATSWEKLVSAMKLDMFVPPKTRENYMDGVAKRSEMYDGSQIEYSNAEEFIKELQRIGVIIEIEIDEDASK